MNAEQESFAPSQPDEEPGAKLFGNRDAEEVRLELLKDEAAVKTIGWLYLLAAIAFFMIWNAAFLAFARGSRSGDMLREVEAVFDSGFFLAATAIFAHALLGNGLRTLHGPARVGGLICGGFLLFAGVVAIGGVLREERAALSEDGRAVLMLAVFGALSLIQIVFLYVLGKTKSRQVCSEEYRDIVRRTPHIQWCGGIRLLFFIVTAIVLFNLVLPILKDI